MSEAGGFIEVDSEVDRGTVFRIRFPATTDPIPPPPEEHLDLPATGNGQVVLLVEDEPALMRSTARMLRNSGYVVLEAPYGADAVAMAHATPIDLLLTDVVMPELSGRQVADEVRMLQPEVGVLFMSGYDPERAPAGDLLRKPFRPNELATRVREVLDGPVPKNLSPGPADG